MKNIIFIIFLTSISFNNSYSQSGWFWQNPLPQGNTLNDNYFINEHTGFLIGNKGIVLKTTNSGVNWQTKYLSTSQNLNAVNCIDLNTGFIVGDSSKIFKTINGGVNWNRINYPGNEKFMDINFYSIDFGMLVGTNTILRSTNAGQNWSNILSLSSSYNLRKISFLDSNNMFIVGRKYMGGLPGYYLSVMLKSSNAGLNWSETNLNTSSLNSIICLSAVNIICTGESSIFRSTDHGVSWVNTISSIFANLKDIQFFDSTIGIVVGSDGNGRILRTINGGETWYNVQTYGFDPNSISMSSLSDGFIVGENGSILKTSNSGTSWSLLPIVLQDFGYLNKVQFIDENTGYICGIGYDIPVYYGGSILKTTNGGENWISQRCFDYTYGNLTDIFFISPHTGFITGENVAFIVKTTNGGSNWNCDVIGPWDLNAIWFSDSLNGTTVGDYGSIYRTNNSGVSWYSQYSNNNIYLYGVHFVNSNIGTAVGSGQGGAILHTTNGGGQWNTQSLGVSSYRNLYDVFLIDENIGFIIGDSHYLYKTTNGGINWISSIPLYNVKLNEIKFSDNNNGIIVGDGGLFLKTTNQGLNWNSINTGTDQNIYGFSFIDNNVGTIVGSNLSILKTTTGGLVDVNLTSSIIPQSFYLYQNYPNPFNPKTKIKFEIPNLSNVKLTIFDMLGKEIKTLIDMSLHAGVYDSEWDGSNFPSGIYFYRLLTNEFAETKKMILLK
ncbi:MAG: T9SS type A sorting domain-containing protein [Ignavibacteria bacterium]|nr:T9SS type A sorting domain-containing protein [Ignavibacteria bacterium]